MNTMRTGRQPSLDVPYRRVRVMEISGDYALTRDSIGKERWVDNRVHRANGAKAQVGEEWMIANDLGPWTFAVALSATVPEVTGSYAADEVLPSLVAALDSLGIIIDATDP